LVEEYHTAPEEPGDYGGGPLSIVDDRFKREAQSRIFQYGVIRTTLYEPGAESTQGLAITAAPSPRNREADAGARALDRLMRENELLVVSSLLSPVEMPAAIATLLPLYLIDDDEVATTGIIRDSYRQFLNVSASSVMLDGSPEASLLRFATIAAFGESALVEESPARRTSPAAVQATAIAHRIMVHGSVGTSATAAGAMLATDGTRPLVVIVGATTTLFMASAGAGLTLAVHWLGKKLDL
jgi:hypothetical protein